MHILKGLRKELGMKQSDLAKQLNVGQSTVSGWENNLFEPDNDSILKIASIFNVSTDYLLGKSDIKKVSSTESVDNLSPEDKELLAIIDSLPLDQQAQVLEYAKLQYAKYLYDKAQKDEKK